MGVNIQGGFQLPGVDHVIQTMVDRNPSHLTGLSPRLAQMALGVNSPRRLPPPSPFSIEHDNLFNNNNNGL